MATLYSYSPAGTVKSAAYTSAVLVGASSVCAHAGCQSSAQPRSLCSEPTSATVRSAAAAEVPTAATSPTPATATAVSAASARDRGRTGASATDMATPSSPRTTMCGAGVADRIRLQQLAARDSDNLRRTRFGLGAQRVRQ